MRCERCDGSGKVVIRNTVSEQTLPGNGLVITQSFGRIAPCLACHGSGVADCCSGPVCDVPEER